MTDYRFTRVLVWDNLGGSVKVARNTTVTVSDPDTGAFLQSVTSDAQGAVSLTLQIPVARFTGPNGYWFDVISPDSYAEASGAAASAQSAADAAAASAQAAQDAANLRDAPADVAIATAINGAGTQTKTALDANYVGKGRAVCKGFTRGDVIACLDAAEALGPHSIAYFPAGTYDVSTGISLDGYSCQILGDGAGGTPDGASRGTTFYASTQSGPVLDFTGWIVPTDAGGQAFTAKVSHGRFAVRGSGVADATTANSGVRLKTMSSTMFHDIQVNGTGGPAWEHVESPGNAVYLCEFERIVLNTPVGAAANDVPYMVMNESNGNEFRRIGFRATSGSNDTGVSGALVIRGNGSYSGYDNAFNNIWFEYLHAQSGGCLISAAVNTSRFHQTGFHDCGKETGATGTAHIRLLPPPTQDYGGNIIEGLIPGSGGGAAEIDMGVDLRQSGNRVVGVRGYSGSCVTIAAGVQRSLIHLGGSQSTPAGTSVTDNSGNPTNVIVDTTGGSYSINRASVTSLSVGSLALASAVIQGSGVDVMSYANNLALWNPEGTGPGQLRFANSAAFILAGTGSPNGVVAAGVGSLYVNLSGGAGTSLWVKESGTGNTGWVGK